MPDLDRLLDALWADYSMLNPQARRIHVLLEARGERIINDHIALRTYGDARVGVEAMARPFVALGYQPRDEYTFPEKKLRARHYQHPEPGRPKVFISELKLGDFPAGLAATVHRLLDQMPAGVPQRPDFPVAGRPWEVTWAEYESLRNLSEYAAWVAAFGFRANHFTVLVNELKTIPDLQSLNDLLVQNGFALNTAGGAIKGSPQVFLEQSSTLADTAPVAFADGTHTIPACYYEFARRYPLPSGELFQGFVEKSADRIFESTDRR